ncbi:MAG: Hpt domain-containing protein [Cyanobacteria bacterium P01_A01_bin.105]
MSNPLHQLFLEEAQALLQVMAAELPQLKQQPNLGALLRAAHTLRGSGAMVGLTAIPAIAQRLEDIFSLMVQVPTPVDDALAALLHQAYRHLRRPIMTDLQGRQHDEMLTLTQAEPVLVALDKWLAETAASLPPPSLSDGAVDMGAVDMVAILFNGDVVAGLETLAATLEGKENDLVAALRSQLDAFVGIGELTSLPGFSAIARAGLIALNCRPSQSRTIGACVLANLRSAHTQVLAGDRQQGGRPSESLLAFGILPDSRPTPQVLPPPAAALNDALKEALNDLQRESLDSSEAAPIWDDVTEAAMLLALFGDEGDEADLPSLNTPENLPLDETHAGSHDRNELQRPQAETEPDLDLESFTTALSDKSPAESPPPPLNADLAPPLHPEVAAPPVDEARHIPVSGLNRPIVSGLPKQLIAKLEALLESAPPEAVAQRAPNSSSPSAQSDRFERLTAQLDTLSTQENKTAQQIQQLQIALSTLAKSLDRHAPKPGSQLNKRIRHIATLVQQQQQLHQQRLHIQAQIRKDLAS